MIFIFFQVSFHVISVLQLPYTVTENDEIFYSNYIKKILYWTTNQSAVVLNQVQQKNPPNMLSQF